MPRPDPVFGRLVALLAGAMLISVSSGCGVRDSGSVPSSNEPAGEQPYRGHLVWGHEARSFTECGSGREGWVVDGTGGDLVEVYRQLTTEPYRPLFVEVRGRWGPARRDGFGADHAEQLEVLELRRAARETKGCDEDLQGIEYVAHGNEPFWRLEIRETGMLFSALGRFDRLEFPSPVVQDDDGATRFISEREGEDPAHIESVITERRCIDSMSGSRFSYAAVVHVNGTTFEGCALTGR
jgi:putative lipoprotein